MKQNAIVRIILFSLLALVLTGILLGFLFEEIYLLDYDADDGTVVTGEVSIAADIDPTSWGVEMWSLATGGIRNVKGKIINDNPERLPCNMAVWWDGDLLREMLNGNQISKYNWKTGTCENFPSFEGTVRNNGTKSNPCVQGDLVGDWREEVLVRTTDNSALRLYISTIPTDYRFHTFLEDPVYRISIATQNVAYNQPTQPGFYIGTDLKKGTVFRGYELK